MSSKVFISSLHYTYSRTCTITSTSWQTFSWRKILKYFQEYWSGLLYSTWIVKIWNACWMNKKTWLLERPWNKTFCTAIADSIISLAQQIGSFTRKALNEPSMHAPEHSFLDCLDLSPSSNLFHTALEISLDISVFKFWDSPEARTVSDKDWMLDG